MYRMQVIYPQKSSDPPTKTYHHELMLDGALDGQKINILKADDKTPTWYSVGLEWREHSIMNFVAQVEESLRDLGSQAKKKHPGMDRSYYL